MCGSERDGEGEASSWSYGVLFRFPKMRNIGKPLETYVVFSIRKVRSAAPRDRYMHIGSVREERICGELYFLHHPIHIVRSRPILVLYIHLGRLRDIGDIPRLQHTLIAAPLPTHHPRMVVHPTSTSPNTTTSLLRSSRVCHRDRVRLLVVRRIAAPRYRLQRLQIITRIETAIRVAAAGAGDFVGAAGVVAGGVAAAGGGAGGGAVEEGDEELAHGGDAGGDYYYELFGPERGV